MLQPFLFIGVGGSGGKTLRVVRAELETRLRAVQWQGDFPTAWQFLHIDVPSKADGDDPDLPTQLPRDCYVPLAGFDLEYKIIDATLMQGVQQGQSQELLEALAGWRPRPEDVHVAIDKGAGQYRALGRAVAVAGLHKLKDAMTTTVSRLGAPEVTGELHRLTEAFQTGEPSVEPQVPTVVVVSSLAGGSGAGVFLDACDVLGIVGGAWASQSVGVLYAPDIFAELKEGAKRGVNPNALATISELCAAYYNHEKPADSEYSLFDRAGLPPGDLDHRGPRFPFVVGGSNGLVNFGDQNDAYRAMGRTLAAWVLSSRVQDSVGAYLKANWQSAADEMAKKSTLGLIGDAGMTPMNALGSSAVTTGRDRFAIYSAERLARLAVNRLLNAHMEGQPRDVKPEVAIETIVRQQQRDFVAASGLDEVGENHNEILDALRPADHVQRFRDFGTDISASLGRQAKAASFFESAISGRFDEQSVRALEAERVSVNAKAREWVAQIQPRIAELVSSTSADFGLPVTTRLVEGLLREVDGVMVDLEQEKQRFEAWASKRGERIPQSLRQQGKGGDLAYDHPLVSKAIQAGLECLDWSAEAELREIAIELVGDLKDNFLSPLARALQHGADVLAEQERGTVPGQASIAQHWPVDNVVPTRFTPAPNERLIELPDEYPGHFETQIRASVTTDDPAGAVRMAVRQVIEGRRRDAETTQLVTILGRWVPRRATARDAAAGPPAGAKIEIACTLDELLDRATNWVRDPNPANAIATFVNQSLREYLSPDAAGAAEHSRRITSFKTAFAAALETARPLVNISNSTLAVVYEGEESPSYELVLTELPFAKGSPAYDAAYDALISHGMSDEAGKAFSDGNQSRIDIFSYLSAPYEPVVFDSLMSPIAADYAKSRGDIGRFWQWRRSRPLPHYIPVSPTVRRTMVRGWWTALILGQIEDDRDSAIKIFSPKVGAYVPFPHPLLSGTVFDRYERLPSLLESLPLAWLKCGAGDQQAIEPYRRLRELGQTRRNEERAYDRLNGELEDWITTATLVRNAPSPNPHSGGDASADFEERRKTVILYLENQQRSYADILDVAIDPRPDEFFKVPRLWELRDDFRRAFTDLLRELRNYTVVEEMD